MPRCRSASAQAWVVSQDWMRLTACCTRGSKSCTPRLARVHPIAASPSTTAASAVHGSISTATSAAGRRRSVTQPLHDRPQPLRRHHRRRAAAPVHMAHRQPAPDRRRHQLDLRQQRLGVGVHGSGLAHHGGVAAAVPAQPGAERHVQVERQHGVVRAAPPASRDRRRRRPRR